jgi:hypothetical protein
MQVQPLNRPRLSHERIHNINKEVLEPNNVMQVQRGVLWSMRMEIGVFSPYIRGRGEEVEPTEITRGLRASRTPMDIIKGMARREAMCPVRRHHVAITWNT